MQRGWPLGPQSAWSLCPSAALWAGGSPTQLGANVLPESRPWGPLCPSFCPSKPGLAGNGRGGPGRGSQGGAGWFGHGYSLLSLNFLIGRVRFTPGGLGTEWAAELTKWHWVDLPRTVLPAPALAVSRTLLASEGIRGRKVPQAS